MTGSSANKESDLHSDGEGEYIAYLARGTMVAQVRTSEAR